MSGDGDEVGVSFNRSSLSFEIATEILLSNRYCTFSPLKLSAERLQAFLEKLILVIQILLFTISTLIAGSLSTGGQ